MMSVIGNRGASTPLRFATILYSKLNEWCP
jgi:hypothetical protein